jgi:ketosteroid isomerase-like protein
MTSNAGRAAALAEALHAGVSGDEATIRRLCTDDVKVWTPVRSAASLDELLEELRRRDDAFSELELDVSPLDVGGDFACVEWRVTMSHTGGMTLRDGAVVEPTGQHVTLHGVTVAEFEGDRICSVRQYWDELAVFEQLGLLDHDAG